MNVRERFSCPALGGCPGADTGQADSREWGFQAGTRKEGKAEAEVFAKEQSQHWTEEPKPRGGEGT